MKTPPPGFAGYVVTSSIKEPPASAPPLRTPTVPRNRKYISLLVTFLLSSYMVLFTEPSSTAGEAKAMTLYHPVTSTPMGRFSYREEPSLSSAPGRAGQEQPGIVLTGRVPTRSSPRGEKKQSQDDSDDDIEVTEEVIVTTPVPADSPRKVTRKKPFVKAKDKVSAATAEDPLGPQTIHPIGSPDSPLATHRLGQLRQVLTSRTVSPKSLFCLIFIHSSMHSFLVETHVRQLHRSRC
jgi:hypothetical protein